MNIIDTEDMIKGLPDAALQKEAQNPSGQAPQFLVVSEIKRRKDMRTRYAQNQQSQGTVKDQLLGMAPPAPQPQMASMGQPQGRSMPPMGGQMPIQQPAPPMGMYSGGVVRMAEGLTVPQTREEQLAFLAGKSPEEILATAAQLGLNPNALIGAGILDESQLEANIQPSSEDAVMAGYNALINPTRVGSYIEGLTESQYNPLDRFTQGVSTDFEPLNPPMFKAPTPQQPTDTRSNPFQAPEGTADAIRDKLAAMNTQGQVAPQNQAAPQGLEQVIAAKAANTGTNGVGMSGVGGQMKAAFEAPQIQTTPQRDTYTAMQGDLIKMPQQQGQTTPALTGTPGVGMSGVGGAMKQMNNAQKEDSSRLKLDSLDESTINAALSDSSNAEREDQGKVNPRSLDSATIDMASNTANPDDKVATEQAKFVTYPEAMYGQKPPSPILSDEGRDAAEGLYSLLNKMTSGSGAGRSTEFISQAELRGRPVSEVQALMAQGWEKTLSGGLSREKPKNIETNAFDPELAGRLTGDEYSKENTPLGMLLNRKESNLVKLAEFAQQNPYAAERIRDAGGARSYLDLIESLDVNEGYKPSTFGTNRGGSEERPTGSRLDSILSEVAALDTSDKPVEVDPSLVASGVGSGKVGPKGRTSTDKSVDKSVQGSLDDIADRTEGEESSGYKIPQSLTDLQERGRALGQTLISGREEESKLEAEMKELIENRTRPTLSYADLIRESEQSMATQLADIKNEKGTQALIALGAGIASGDLGKGLSDAGKAVATSNAQKRALEARQQAVRMGFRKSEVDAVYQNQIAKENDKLEGMKFSLESLRRANAATQENERIILNFDTDLQKTIATLEQSERFKRADREKQDALSRRAALDFVTDRMSKMQLLNKSQEEQTAISNDLLAQASIALDIEINTVSGAGSTTSTASPATTTIGGYSVTQKQ
tara:strand:+ start:1459 stop:4275 length:2817 start_codon:yes stop_codon:yes gene_type:complete